MRTAVLQNMKEVAEARDQLSQRKLGWKKNELRILLEKFHLIRSQPNVGDEIKSWDVLRTVNFAIENLKPTDPVLDIGAFSSEICRTLKAPGYAEVTSPSY